MKAPLQLLVLGLGITTTIAWHVPSTVSPTFRRFASKRWVSRDQGTAPLVEVSDDDEYDFDEDEELPVIARCPDTSRVVECYVDYPVDVGGATYTVLKVYTVYFTECRNVSNTWQPLRCPA
jgi:hypothetical protein